MPGTLLKLLSERQATSQWKSTCERRAETPEERNEERRDTAL